MSNMSNTQPILLESNASLIPTVDGLAIKRQQFITSEFVDRCKEDRFYSTRERIDEFQSFARIPTTVLEKWLRAGFDAMNPNVKASEIIARLNREGLDDFITTNKSV
jgi:hypothetical protein